MHAHAGRRTAVVTGSTSGIGLAIARAFAATGAAVVMNGFGEAHSVEAARAAIEREFGVPCHHSPADMTRPADVSAMVAEAEKRFGSVDVLVNNAGIQHLAPVEEFPLEQWDRIIAVNLSSCFHTIRAAVPGMKRRGRGRIINIASGHALVASPFKSAYVAAKHGVAGLTKTVALELATTGVTCNAICPGYVNTPLVERQVHAAMEAHGLPERQAVEDVILKAQPTKRFVTAQEVAALAVHVASDAAAGMTGSMLSIDGGWTAA